MTVLRLFLVVALLASGADAFGQGKKKGDSGGDTRTVQGVVTSPEDMPVTGAVVQLKNTKTLQIRSFITQQNGSYFFNGLSTDVDYELKAESQGASSPVKTLSSFDSRKQAVLNLKLNKK
jgi:Carboxypeptidase regulatory-like domain